MQVFFDGTVLADTGHAVALLETHLPTRWYLPRDDVNVELLQSSDHRRTDLVLDGAPAARPVTPWSSPEEQQRRFAEAASSEELEFG